MSNVDRSDLYSSLDHIRDTLRRFWGVQEIHTDLGTHGVMYTYGPDSGEPTDGDYATVGLTLPDEFYAEIEDGTFGQLQGLRVYADDIGLLDSLGSCAVCGREVSRDDSGALIDSTWGDACEGDAPHRVVRTRLHTAGSRVVR